MRRTRRARRAATTARGLAILLAGAGVTHFLRPRVYDGIVPEALPTRATTIGSGVAEVAVAAALAVPRTRRIGGFAAAALFVAVFPANLKMARDLLDDPRSQRRMRVAALLRLPLQVPLVRWGLRVGMDTRP
ncbi:hypothetical protein [Curtobacterium sp. MCBD17_040]|uniref:hypothetical protein n=1 Tax=Curtobacterium sp. MCBD17_040 TaxID=2175674 RepID=UPI000DA939D5|nr:hypothetical protein [Curtobacterium sp. MCBD17_040]WIB62772.1 hypothetical protein DEI94_11420 [Curtobacterium sp. MCBD17_040]